MIYVLTLSLSVMAVTATAPGIAAAAEQLNLASNEKLVEQVIAARLLTDIYKRSELIAKITPLPPARANLSTLNGTSDGEVARVDAYAKKNPTLIQVMPAYYYLTTVAYSKANISIQTKEDLKKYRIGAIRGVAHSDAITEGLSDVGYVNDARTLFLLLKSGRFDIAIDTGANGKYMIKEMKLDDIHAVGELARLELFNILAPHKMHLAESISKTIRKLKSSGEFEPLVKRYELEFLQSGVAP